MDRESIPAGTVQPPPAIPLPLSARSWLVAALFAVLAFVLYTWDNDFPYYYHTDEPSKTSQLIREQFNFNHPMLLMETTHALLALTGAPSEHQAVVERGRDASAIFAALAVGGMVLLGWQFGGRWVGTIAGVLTVSHPLLFELAHYMKEDCALMVGLAWSAVALAAYARQTTLRRAALVGIGAGLALAGKYIGSIMTGTALFGVLLTVRSAGKRRSAFGIAVLAATLTFATVDARALANFSRARQSLGQELEKINLRKEEREEKIKFKHLSKLGTTLSAPLLIGLGYWIVQRWRKRDAMVWRVLGGFVVGYFLIISLSPKTKERYLLPVFVFACPLGAAGLWEWTRRQPEGSRRRWIGPALAVTAVAWHIPDYVVDWKGFARDDRLELTQWLRENVPAKDGIAHDVRAHLVSGQKSGLPEYVLPNPLYTSPVQRYVADLGTLEELKARGVTHIVVCQPDYHSALTSSPKKEYRKFYEHLFANYPVVWERAPSSLQYLQPGIKVYRIVPAKG